MYWYNESSSEFMHKPVNNPSNDYPKLYVSPEMRIDIREVILGLKIRDSNSNVTYLQEELKKSVKRQVIQSRRLYFWRISGQMKK